MGKIIQLDPTLANQIAAGEVVERPVSVVKELVENSLDAGATRIQVSILGGGIDSITVSDNGSGISVDDLPEAIKKYSTSKISSLEDLYQVMTFGFRGEALASIASVSKFSLVSSSGGKSYRLDCADGATKGPYEYPLDTGTRVEVGSLFYNTPARLNYLKTPRTEQAHIVQYLQQMALVYPGVSFECIADDKQVFYVKGTDEPIQRIYEVYGQEVSDSLLRVDVQLRGIGVSGYISDPKVSYANKQRQSLYINSRSVTSPIIFTAIQNAYNRFIPHGQFPVYILNIEVDPTQVDVNVHPRKKEVRFANESEIFRAVYHAIEDTLTNVSLIKRTSPAFSEASSGGVEGGSSQNTFSASIAGQKYYTGSGTKFKSYSPYKDTSPNPNQQRIGEAMNFSRHILGGQPVSSLKSESLPGKDTNYHPEYSGGSLPESMDLHTTPAGKIIGQMFNSYIVVEAADGVYIYDQHALAERIIYEKLAGSSYAAATQGLLVAESMVLTAKEYSIVLDHLGVFQEMGFDIEDVGNHSILINGIPDFIKKERVSEVVSGVIQDIGEEGWTKSTALQEVRNKIFAYTACRSAIKFGHKLSVFEMHALLEDAFMDYSATCPHGRPVVFSVSLDELKGRYER